jgi:hypothetical protein
MPMPVKKLQDLVIYQSRKDFIEPNDLIVK